MEIAWAIGVSCMAYLLLAQVVQDFPTPLVLLSQQMSEGINTFVLLSVPMFVLAGELMNRSGITRRLIDVAGVLVGHYRGGLGNVSVTSNFFMAGVSGSALADAAAIGSMMVPEMKRKGFHPAYASAVIAFGATMAPVIPPSVTFLLLGAIVEISVGQLFLAGVLPGALMFISMMVLTWWLAVRRGFPVEPRPSWPQVRQVLLRGIWPLLVPIIVIRGIVTGMFTATEAAAVVVAYALFLGAVVYRSLGWRDLVGAAGDAALTSAVIMLTVATSQIFANLAVQEHLGRLITDGLLAVSRDPTILLLMINGVLLVLGMFMEPLPVMLILAPILFPLLGSMGVDPIHFGVVMVLNLMIGMVTPPVGLNLFVLGAISGENVMTIFRHGLPYFLALAAVLVAVTYVPWLSLWLPTLYFR
ncbi:MAG: TRAP transporter large permease [Thalassobaculales bacterium]